jgi:hypothetical protein
MDSDFWVGRQQAGLVGAAFLRVRTVGNAI